SPTRARSVGPGRGRAYDPRAYGPYGAGARVGVAPSSRKMLTYCGWHCDLLESLGSETGILVGIHSCSSLNITVPRSLCSTASITGIDRKVRPGVRATGQGRS